jgi:hypothetical protein
LAPEKGRVGPPNRLPDPARLVISDAYFVLTGKAGTRLLAKCLRETHGATSTQEDRDQISNAIVAMHASQRRNWSLRSFTNEYLSGTAKQLFISRSPPESRTTTFRVQKDEFEQKLNFRVFRLEDNVMVSAPFGAIGKSVSRPVMQAIVEKVIIRHGHLPELVERMAIEVGE